MASAVKEVIMRTLFRLELPVHAVCPSEHGTGGIIVEVPAGSVVEVLSESKIAGLKDRPLTIGCRNSQLRPLTEADLAAQSTLDLWWWRRLKAARTLRTAKSGKQSEKSNEKQHDYGNNEPGAFFHRPLSPRDRCATAIAK
jgi:hypothetical protein